MRISSLLGSTLRQSSSSNEIVSHDLLLRAGYTRQLSSGIFSYLHLGFRSLKKIEGILREEMDKIGGVEISMPVVHPAEIWRQTGRYDIIDESLVRFKDRHGKDMVLAMTHEEVVAEIASREISSYKQLPKLIYQIQTKFRDEARPRGGLIRVREFVMKDSYSLDKNYEGLKSQYIAHYNAYHRIMERVGLPVIAIRSDVGMMGGTVAHEFMYISKIGEDSIFVCHNCGYKANKEVATFRKESNVCSSKPIEKIYTPGITSIDDLASSLGIEKSKIGKSVFYYAIISTSGESKLVLALVRGDVEVNEVKVKNLTNAQSLRPATKEEIESTGIVPGYGSPIDIRNGKNTLVIVDDIIPDSGELVLGANEEGVHFANALYGRDYYADVIGDISSAYENAPCKNCGTGLELVRGVEVGNIFQLGTKYSESVGVYFNDESGGQKPVIMGSYGIGVGRLLACVSEEYNDEKGLKLPISIAPYQVYLILLPENEEILEKGTSLYKELIARGIEVLFDDRELKVAGAGVKFKDADLLGMPLIVILSKKSLISGGVEIKMRSNGQTQIISISDLPGFLEDKIRIMKHELMIKADRAVSWNE